VLCCLLGTHYHIGTGERTYIEFFLHIFQSRSHSELHTAGSEIFPFVLVMYTLRVTPFEILYMLKSPVTIEVSINNFADFIFAGIFADFFTFHQRFLHI
jgi:hypothetical protein